MTAATRCPHLARLEQELTLQGLKPLRRAPPQLDPSWPQYAEWVWYDCTFDVASLSARLSLAEPVKFWNEFDYHFGGELGFTCEQCRFGIMGVHPDAREHALRVGQPAAPLFR
ncbi:MAG TPA: hypothetical protein VHB79_27550 [Polyangiaceae bacterium]|nr:hypothetical protein [Polyangiaceae bacterium]